MNKPTGRLAFAYATIANLESRVDELMLQNSALAAEVERLREVQEPDVSALVEVPDWLLEMSRQMATQPARSTSHPFWQVRCKSTIPTQQGYGDCGYEIIGDEGVVYRSQDDVSELHAYLLENHEDWCLDWALYDADEDVGVEPIEAAMESFDPEGDDLPDGLSLVYVQEIEEVVSTHLTQADAEWFIQRKQHDYPKLYTYVESAYWSPQIRKLQDWIIGITKGPESALATYRNQGGEA